MSDCRCQFKKMVSSDDMVNVKIYVDFDCAETFYQEAPKSFKKSNENGKTNPRHLETRVHSNIDQYICCTDEVQASNTSVGSKSLWFMVSIVDLTLNYTSKRDLITI